MEPGHKQPRAQQVKAPEESKSQNDHSLKSPRAPLPLAKEFNKPGRDETKESKQPKELKEQIDNNNEHQEPKCYLRKREYIQRVL